ncbi:MAG: hypothetical protein H7Y33_12080 [Cytophagales bacterium]|nr:hypothetical protein [Rhizobacter sp.]
MKTTRAILMASAFAAAFAVTAASAQTSVGVSVGINQPGVYGRVDIGNMPPPPVVYVQPRYYGPPPVQVVQPAYLYVPPGHQKNWRKHCHRYNACGQPVYFVKESWVRERYEREHDHGHDRDDGKHGKKDKHDKKGKHGKD